MVKMHFTERLAYSNRTVSCLLITVLLEYIDTLFKLKCYDNTSTYQTINQSFMITPQHINKSNQHPSTHLIAKPEMRNKILSIF